MNSKQILKRFSVLPQTVNGVEFQEKLVFKYEPSQAEFEVIEAFGFTPGCTLRIRAMIIRSDIEHVFYATDEIAKKMLINCELNKEYLCKVKCHFGYVRCFDPIENEVSYSILQILEISEFEMKFERMK